MTKEEAIRNLGLLRIFDAPDLNEAVKMAVAALRAQQAPAKLDRSRWSGCEYCKDMPVPILKGFCCACGRPLTEEAWAEMERRIGGTNDN